MMDGKVVGLLLTETTIEMDVLVVKTRDVLIVTDVDSTGPRLPAMVEFVTFESEKGPGVPVDAAEKVILANERDAEAVSVRLLIFLVLTGGPVSLVALDSVTREDANDVKLLVFLLLTDGSVSLIVAGVRVDSGAGPSVASPVDNSLAHVLLEVLGDGPLPVRLPTGSETFIVVNGTEVVSSGMVDGVVALVGAPDGRGVNANVVDAGPTVPTVKVRVVLEDVFNDFEELELEDEFLDPKGTVTEEIEVDEEIVPEAVAAAEALVENELIRVKLVERDTVPI